MFKCINNGLAFSNSPIIQIPDQEEDSALLNAAFQLDHTTIIKARLSTRDQALIQINSHK